MFSECLESLKISDMYERADQIAPAIVGTLDWLLRPDVTDIMQQTSSSSVAITEQDKSNKFHRSNNTGLASWLSSGEEVFWIQGKPGSGKSTAMKHIFASPRTREALEACQMVGFNFHIFGFFFTDRGNDTQKSWDYMLHVILFQLLEAVSPLYRLVLPLGMRRTTGPPSNNPKAVVKHLSFSWTGTALEAALLKCKQQNIIQFRTLILLDALDEHGGRHERMGRFLKALGTKPGPEEATHIKICVSSRPIDELKDLFRQCPGFEIHHFTEPDVQRYIGSRMTRNPRMQKILNDSNIRISSSGLQLMNEIFERARGVFLWVRLVIDELIKALDDNKSLDSLKLILKDLPDDLTNFYIHMVEKIDREYSREAYIILQAVLCARNPLTVRQLAMILVANTTDVAGKIGLYGLSPEVSFSNNADCLSR
jgi:NACHT domain